MVFHTRGVKLGNFMFWSVVHTKICISQEKTKQVHGSELYLGKENTKTSPLPHR